MLSRILRTAAALLLASSIVSCVSMAPPAPAPLPASPSPLDAGTLAAPSPSPSPADATTLAAPSPADAGALATTAAVVFSQAPSPGGGLLQSSLRDPDGSAIDEWAWDDFTLERTQVISEVQWRGGYDPARNGSGGPVVDFKLVIYPSILGGSQPDVTHPPLADFQLGGNAAETPADVLDGVQTYDYRYSLPVPFQVAAGAKYWVQIEAFQGGVPDWGLSTATGGDGRYFRKLADEGIYQHATGDAAFTLLGAAASSVYLPLIVR